MCIVFNTLLNRHFSVLYGTIRMLFIGMLTDLVLSKSCSKILSPVEKSRRNGSEQPGISTMPKTFAPLFFILIRVFIPVFNNL